MQGKQWAKIISNPQPGLQTPGEPTVLTEQPGANSQQKPNFGKLRNAGLLPCSPRILILLVNTAAPQGCSHRVVLSLTAFHQCSFQCGAGTNKKPTVLTGK